MKSIIIAALATLMAIPANAAERTVSLNSNDLFALMVSLDGLNGRQTLDKDKKSVTLPYDFSGATTLALAKDLRVVTAELQDYRNAVRKQSTGDKTEDAKKANDLALVKRNVILETFPSAGLKLDENHLTPSILSGLWPILEDQREAPKTDASLDKK